ncbi:hypothetical protein MKK75_03125 [Methylobacterium sp. J-030]|uniref:hypothetical protein n=1 Tax=Methylobacterium sp. J-030 TaxID=2836627 RepID=UPI001FBBA5E1|nr:hypothetical protein [Methylobacterium sp. J-030]MCJ2067808.1 hypothetical protein [Methylobacterium sp. J-030]
MTPAATFSAGTARVALGGRAGGLHWCARLAATLAVALTFEVAHAQSHADQLKVYARTLSTTTFAEQACSGLRASAPKLALLRMQARITDSEDAVIADRIRESTAAVIAAYERSGKDAWCADTYRQFGPDGALAKGALEKKP